MAVHVNTLPRFSGHRSDAPHHAFARRYGATNNEYGVITADGAEDVRPTLTVEGRRDRLSAARDGSQDEHLADAIDPQKELWKEGVERCAAFLDAAIGHSIASALRRRNAGQAELPEIAGERGLGHVPAALQKELPQIFLTADSAIPDDLEDGVVTLSFVCHQPRV
jgi:hypothetical protein